MRNIKPIVMLHVTSEPGDATRYDFTIGSDGPDDYVIGPLTTTFRLPQRMSIYTAKAIENLVAEQEGELRTNTAEFNSILAAYPGVNPHTVIEVARTIVYLYDKPQETEDREEF